MDPILNLRITALDRRGLLEEVGRMPEAFRSPPVKRPRGAFPYEMWLAGLDDRLIFIGMKLRVRTYERFSDSGLNVA